MYNLLIGGAAGQGVDTAGVILERLLKQSGYGLLAMRDFMSRIRGGHNFTRIRFGESCPSSHSEVLDGMIALNQETIELHLSELREQGFILCDSSIPTEDARAITLDLSGIAKELGNPRVSSSVAIGAILKIFSIPVTQEAVRKIFEKSVKAEYVEINLQAIQAGYERVEAKFPYQQGAYEKHMIVSGSQALALGALAAGLQFYSAYPMSPSTSIMEYLAQKSLESGIVVEQAEDEIAAINMALGASFTGARAMTGTSGGGFSLKVEALGMAGMAEIPLVAVDV